MKMFVAVFVLVTVVVVQGGLTPAQLEKLVGYSKDCRAQTGATIEMVTKAVAGDFVNDPKLKDQLFCISKKVGFQNEAGDLNKDVLKEKINSVLNNPAQTEEVIAECALSKATPSETAYDSLKCYFEKRGINLIG